MPSLVEQWASGQAERTQSGMPTSPAELMPPEHEETAHLVGDIVDVLQAMSESWRDRPGLGQAAKAALASAVRLMQEVELARRR